MARARRTTIPTETLLPLDDAHWNSIVAAIGPSAKGKRLPDGKSLRDGFQWVISRGVYDAGEPTPGQLRAENRRFARVVVNAFGRLHPDLQSMWREESYVGLPIEVSYTFKNIDESFASIADEKPAETFLADVVWLIKQSDVALTLPGNAYISDAKKYILVRAARAAIKVAITLAQAHNPRAVPGLQRLNNSDFSLVRKLRTALKATGAMELRYLVRGSSA